MLKWKSSWNKSCRSRKTEQSWYSKVFHLTSGTVRKSQRTSFSGRNHRNFGRNHRNFVFWIWIPFSFGISEIRRNFGRNFVSGSGRDSVQKRKGEPWCQRPSLPPVPLFFTAAPPVHHTEIDASLDQVLLLTCFHYLASSYFGHGVKNWWNDKHATA